MKSALAMGRATPAVLIATGHAAAIYCKFEDAAVENIAASDPHRASLGLSSLAPPCLTNLGGFGEDCSSDVEEPTADVGVCKADHFVADEAEEAVKGEKRRVWGRVLCSCATSSFTLTLTI